ncbi:MAG: hypothetical protein MJ099_04640 [Clostridia bacterium]|nr:hypothetical protein [Clostridia bacterium]
MKKGMKRSLAVLLAMVVVVGLGFFSRDVKLKASEDDGSVTAVEQQEVRVEETKPVVVEVPKAEPAPAPEPKQEEPAPAPAPEPEAKQEEPAPAPEPEVKEEPVAEPEVQPEPVVEEKTEEPAPVEAFKEYDVTVRLATTGDLYVGDTVKLKADITGGSGAAYTIRWQYNKGQGWNDIANEDEDVYDFEMTEENAEYQYRVVLEYEI